MLQNKLSYKHYYKDQAGNVFIVILLGVFLFGALMYMFSRSAQQGTGNLTKQQAKIAAQEILNYARLVEGAVDRIRRNGCSESEISFENDVVSGYINPNAPADKSCHVFDGAGGKVSWSDVANNVTNDNSNYSYSGRNSILNVGDDNSVWCYNQADPSRCAELIMFIADIDEGVCKELNYLTRSTLNIDNYSGSPNPISKFVGSFNGTHIAGGNERRIECNSRPNSFPRKYHFYHTLLAR